MTSPKQKYRELLAKEQAAWDRLHGGRDDDSHDPDLMSEWLDASRACAAARDSFIGLMMAEDNSPRRARRIPVDALPADVRAAVRRTLNEPDRFGESDFGVCIHDPRTGEFACLSAQTFDELKKLSVSLIDPGWALGGTKPAGCECDYVFDPTH